MPILAVFNPRRRRLRWPLKLGVAAGALVLILFPRLDLLARNIGHWSNLGKLIDPNAPGIEDLTAKVTTRLKPDAPPEDALAVTQAVVYESITYAFDWDTWGVADYVPTAAEALRAGQEDCDGQAVIAASILTRLGYDARLVSDMGHVWVWTPHGQTMSPSETASGEIFVKQDEAGRSTLNWKAVLSVRGLVNDWGRNLAYSIAVFPAWREAIFILTIWALLLSRRPRWAAAVVSLGVILAGWMVIRETSADFWSPSIAGSWAGILLTVAGLFAAKFSGRRRSTPDPAAQMLN